MTKILFNLNTFQIIKFEFINKLINSHLFKSDFSLLLLITIIGIAGIMILFTKYYFDQKNKFNL